MSLSLLSCCLETLIGLAYSHGFGVLLARLVSKLEYLKPLVRGHRIIRTSYQLDAKLEPGASSNDAFAAGRLLQPGWYRCVQRWTNRRGNSIKHLHGVEEFDPDLILTYRPIGKEAEG
jgi:hypothetical protein